MTPKDHWAAADEARAAANDAVAHGHTLLEAAAKAEETAASHGPRAGTVEAAAVASGELTAEG